MTAKQTKPELAVIANRINHRVEELEGLYDDMVKVDRKEAHQFARALRVLYSYNISFKKRVK
jgi:nitrate/nitrite-specific signal transduction histidine kinase